MSYDPLLHNHSNRLSAIHLYNERLVAMNEADEFRFFFCGKAI